MNFYPLYLGTAKVQYLFKNFKMDFVYLNLYTLQGQTVS